MASGLFAILDDVATLLDDTAALTKVAAKKTGSILVDDMAVNAEKATGFHHDRELPVLWAIAKGSMLNKLIILPIALLLSAFAPWAILPVLLIGGLYLAFEGAEKMAEWLGWHAHEPTPDAAQPALTATTGDAAAIEAAKIRSAILTDFILSIEIIVIALGSVVGQPLLTQVIVTSLIAIVATIGVYGLVAAIIRMDNVGLALIERGRKGTRLSCRMAHALGQGLVTSMPRLIKALSIIGTLAMVLVGGGIFVHNLPMLHHLNEHYLSFAPLLGEFGAGLLGGFAVMGLIMLLRRAKKHAAP
ncbi:MAG: DUF808 domain-containing protein [Halothiobacillaceae bacterium]|nr:DUF808 domain-containing protein [Halothiobacillaceae bacterium]